MGNQKGSSAPAHDTGVKKGEDITKEEGKESGREEKGKTHKGRPAGGSTARDSTRINPENENPIDPESPNLPPS